MRKDLRLGLGIGALALLFAVTFLVVRNHTQNQSQDQVAQELVVPVDAVTSGPPAANHPKPGSADVNLSTRILPPMQPVPQADASGPSQKEDPWIKQHFRSPEAPMPGTAKVTNRGSNSNWDLLLNQGRRESASGAAFSRTPDTTLTADSLRQSQPLPSPRPSTLVGQLSAATSRSYTIRSGDTFSSVAKQTYGAEKYYLQIEQANPNVNTMRLQPGQQIVLPDLSAENRTARGGASAGDEATRPINAAREYRVDVGDSLYRISMKLYGTPRMSDAIYEANRSAIGSDPDQLRLGMVLRLPQDLDNSK